MVNGEQEHRHDWGDVWAHLCLGCNAVEVDGHVLLREREEWAVLDDEDSEAHGVYPAESYEDALAYIARGRAQGWTTCQLIRRVVMAYEWEDAT